MTTLYLDAPCVSQNLTTVGQTTIVDLILLNAPNRSVSFPSVRSIAALTFLNVTNRSVRFPSVGATVRAYLYANGIQHNHTPTVRLIALLYAQPILNAAHETLPTLQASYGLVHKKAHSPLTAQHPLVSPVFAPQPARNLQVSDIPSPQLSLISQPKLDHNQLTIPDEVGDFIQVGRGLRITASKRKIIS